jgi:hypothetical protein
MLGLVTAAGVLAGAIPALASQLAPSPCTVGFGLVEVHSGGSPPLEIQKAFMVSGTPSMFSITSDTCFGYA